MTTTPSDSDPAVNAAAPPPRTNPWQRIAGVLFAPAETFQGIVRSPDVLVPLIVVLLIGIASVVIMGPRVDFDRAYREAFERRQNMSPADVDRAVRMMASVGKVFLYVTPVLNLVWLALMAAIFLLVFRMFGGEGTYKQAMSIAVYSWIPLLIYSLIMAAVLLTRSNVLVSDFPTLVRSNPAFLVNPVEQPFAFALLSSLDVFTIWTLILMIIGYATMSRLSRTASAAIIISLWLVVVLLKLGGAALQSAS